MPAWPTCRCPLPRPVPGSPPPPQEKNASEPELTPRLEGARADAVSLALQAGLVQQECGLALTPEEFVGATLKFGLSEVRGSRSAGLCAMLLLFRGRSTVSERTMLQPGISGMCVPARRVL